MEENKKHPDKEKKDKKKKTSMEENSREKSTHINKHAKESREERHNDIDQDNES